MSSVQSIAFTAYTWLLQRCPPALVATHTYANPVVAVFLGWLLASEPLTMRVVLASIAILGAIVLIRKGERSVAAKHPDVVSPVAKIEKQECALAESCTTQADIGNGIASRRYLFFVTSVISKAVSPLSTARTLCPITQLWLIPRGRGGTEQVHYCTYKCSCRNICTCVFCT